MDSVSPAKLPDGSTKVLLTGASGFVGKKLVKEVLQLPQYFSLTAFVRKTTSMNAIPSSVPRLEADLSNKENLVSCVKGFDLIVHSAATMDFYPSTPQILDAVKSNFNHTRNLIEASYQNGIKNFIMISTSMVLKESNKVVNEESAMNSDYEYGISKIRIERFMKCFTKEHPDWKYTILRPTGKRSNRRNILSISSPETCIVSLSFIKRDLL